MRDKECVEPAVDILIDDLEEVQKQGYQTIRDQKERALLLPLLCAHRSCADTHIVCAAQANQSTATWRDARP